ncbi:MAG: hypothetical protein ACQEVA_21925 [Myxococcota bacterium]
MLSVSRVKCVGVLLILLVAAGCSDGTSTVNNGNNSSNNANNQADTGGEDTSEEDTESPDTSEEPTIESIAIEPATAQLTSANGSRPTQDFDVIATYSDGRSETYNDPVEFEIDNSIIGRVDEANGEFTASGVAGGEATITANLATVGGISPATATVNVDIEYVIEGPNLPADYQDKFNAPGTDASEAPNVVYPLSGAVMPQNVYPADIQWTNGAQGDLFKVEITKPGATITAYLAHEGPGFGNHWLVDEDAWRALAQTDAGEAAQIRVVRHVASTGNTVRDEFDKELTFAPGSLTGSVYYWDISATRIKRIDDGTGQAVSFMPDPPNSAGGGQNCVGCHSVSNNGRYMVGRLGPGNNIGTVFDLTQDLTQDPVPSEFALQDDGTRWWFSTWNPDDTRLMVTQGDGQTQGLSLMDPFTGQIVQPQAGSLPQSGTTQPAWAPDNSLVAYVNNGDAWGGQLGTGDIATIPVTGPDSFGQPQTILEASSVSNTIPGADTACYPTWSPDAEWIAFAHGTGARSESEQSALYIMKRDGSSVSRLTNASGGPNAAHSFQPNFSPFEAGGYYWLSFLSTRPYGNAEVGTAGLPTPHQQIWVAGIEKSASPGSDPSVVAFWLPGQSVQAQNIAGFWAPRACREDGNACSVGSECCSGECVPDADGELACSPPPVDRCREANETCTNDSDCCSETALCLNNVCVITGG